MHAVRTIAPCLVSLVVLSLGSAPALAQDALGSGNALDANLNPQSGGVNRPTSVEDFAGRNRIITNNVMGGRGFRGSVGYAASDDFRGLLGSDDLYQFRADSALSSVNFITYGNTYERLRFGQNLGLMEYRRAGEGSTLRTVMEEIYRPGDMVEARLRLDQLNFASSMTSARDSAIEPSNIGIRADSEGRAYVIGASGLRGLSATPINQEPQFIGLSSYDAALYLEALVSGEDVGLMGQPFVGSFQQLEPSDVRIADEPADRLAGADAMDERVDVDQPPAFEKIQQRIARRYQQREGEEADRPGFHREIDEEFQRWRDQVRGVEETPEAAAPGAQPGESESQRRARERMSRLTQPGEQFAEEPKDDEEDRQPPEPALLDVEDLAMILRHGQRIDKLATADPGRFNQLLREAEEALRDGEYFFAERRFNRALRFTPGHPLATAGLAHAQIGAQLYLSASLTLRGLFTYQPEMIDARYDPGLVPNRPELLQAVTALEQRLARPGGDRADTAFLLAYLGRLLDERALTERSLALLAQEQPDDPLVRLLEAIWLAEEEPDEDGPPAESGPDGPAPAGNAEEPEK